MHTLPTRPNLKPVGQGEQESSEWVSIATAPVVDLERHTNTPDAISGAGRARLGRAKRIRPARRFRWRYLTAACMALVLVVLLIAGGLVLLRDAFNDSNRLPAQSAPTLAELNQSIELGQRYIEALYKPLQNGEAVQSEASGVPLKAHFLDDNTWVLLGEDKTVCDDAGDDCQPTTFLGHDSDDLTHDRYTAGFSTPTQRNALVVNVEINWAFSPTRFQVQTTPESVTEKVELWLDDTKLASYPAGSDTPTARTFNDSDQSQMRMLRFTVRHATQEAYVYWSTYGHDPVRAAALKKFLEANGYIPGFDLRAPLFDMADNLPDDLPVDSTAYADCDHTAAGDQHAYAYHSKVCLQEGLYLDSGERDPLLQAWAALTVLMKYDDPDHEQPEWGWWTQGNTPAAVSAHLHGQWNRTGDGVPKCTPFGCAEVSGIRTSVFGALETQLGYVYGDAVAQHFADAAAKVITQAQVKADGKIVASNGNVYFRPAQVGSYLTAWAGSDLRFTQSSTPALPIGIALWLKDSRPTPLEYGGVIPSNSETSFDALGFLMMYRCQKYQICY